MKFSSELVWHDDGHQLTLELVRDELSVLSVFCPVGATDCTDRDGRCVVETFVHRYGLECHVGQCAPAEEITVAWSLNGHIDDLDESQVWVISVTDPLFASWRSAQLSTE